MIAPAAYQNWEGQINIPYLTGSAKERIARDASFLTIQENSKWLGSQKEQKVSLEIGAYKAAAVKLKQVTEQNDKVVKLPAGRTLIVQPVIGSGDLSFEQWLNTMNKDIYIDRAAEVIIDMVEHHK